jgi:hypothetical protein
VRVEAKAEDTEGPHLSRIKNATLRIQYDTHGPFIQDYVVIMKYDPIRDIFWRDLTEGTGLQDECWHKWTVTVFDYAENGPVTSELKQFFWFMPLPDIGAWTTDPCFLYHKMINP